jgi:hypothetical protein
VSASGVCNEPGQSSVCRRRREQMEVGTGHRVRHGRGDGRGRQSTSHFKQGPCFCVLICSSRVQLPSRTVGQHGDPERARSRGPGGEDYSKRRACFDSVLYESLPPEKLIDRPLSSRSGPMPLSARPLQNDVVKLAHELKEVKEDT